MYVNRIQHESARPGAEPPLRISDPSRLFGLEERTARASGRHPLDNENKPVILIVDDESDVREYLRIILEDHGYRVIEADSGKAALTIAAKQDPPLSLMITDVLMPHMHGKDLAIRVRSILPQLKILYMSGYALEILSELNLCPDPSALMRKPLDVNATLATVKRFLKG